MGANRERDQWRERLAQRVPVAKRAVVDLFAVASPTGSFQGRGHNHKPRKGSHE
jgi:hypothetical protein